ncbi:QsdR family transcriptional regulator [Cryptosporangium arvum]|uniref:Transcriptional regulator, TetR family n=1 Tax=Cryptosporangium arvum DSM 44712 TaxID=927661 RepID=A0A011AL44_9ACTN|nr:QsdR family transcriptional regulator [Cryptosporangium arvum]EXG82671.1 transcriptional regulator, TetR family [Cryptosporangium arvum DSM 44712]
MSARPTATDAFRLARRTFLAGERVDLKRLAAELDVDRSTLFRWLGNRDQLLVDILISLSDPTLRTIVRDAEGTGGRRVARIAGAYAAALIDASYYREFMRREPERALRLITTKASPVQRRVVDEFARLLAHESTRGELRHPLGTNDLAYLIVRIIESFIYADLITGEEPEAAKVETAVAAILRADGP